MTIYAYLRVSTNKGQDTDNQKKLIHDAGNRVDEWIVEEGVSGSVKACERKEFKKMLSRLVQGDIVICTMIDRLGRDAEDILATVRLFKELGVGLKVMQVGGMDITSSMGKVVLTVMAAFAQLEKDLIVERVKSGLERTKASGTILGRGSKLTPEQLKEVLVRRSRGFKSDSLEALSKEYGMSAPALCKVLKKFNFENLKDYETIWNSRVVQLADNNNKRAIKLMESSHV